MDGRIHLEVGRGVIVHYRHSRPGHGIGRGFCACRKGDFFRGLCRSIKTLSNILYICRILQIDFAGILPYQHTDAQRQRDIVGLAQGFLGTDGGRSRGIGSDFSAALVGLQGAFHIHHGLVVQLGHRHRGALGSLTQLQVTVIDNIQNPAYNTVGAGGHARRKGAVGSNGQSFPVRRICASSFDDRILADIGLGLYMVNGQHRIHINEAQYIGACSQDIIAAAAGKELMQRSRMVATIGHENILRLGSNVDILARDFAVGIDGSFNRSQGKGFLVLGRSRNGHVPCGADGCSLCHSDRRFQLDPCPVAGGAAVSHSRQHDFPVVTGFLQGKIPRKPRICRRNIDQTGKVKAVLAHDAGTALQIDIAAPEACPIHRIDLTGHFDGGIGIQGNGAILNLAPPLGKACVINTGAAHHGIVF